MHAFFSKPTSANNNSRNPFCDIQLEVLQVKQLNYLGKITCRDYIYYANVILMSIANFFFVLTFFENQKKKLISSIMSFHKLLTQL